MGRLHLLAIVFVFAACTAMKVTPLNPTPRVRKVCIEANPKVIVIGSSQIDTSATSVVRTA